MKINTDCRYYVGSRPCVFHKADGRSCHDCGDYVPLSQKILIVKLDAMGDVLRTTSILPALHREYPGAQVTWVTRERSRILLEGNQLVDRVLTVEGGYLEALQALDFELGIGLDADSQSAQILTNARCGEKRGFVVERFGRGIPANAEAEEWWLMGVDDHRKKANRRTYQDLMYQICRLPPPTARPLLPERLADAASVRDLRDQYRLTDKRRIIGINTGGGERWQCKKWTVGGYIELIRRLRARLSDAALLLYGGPDERDFNASVLASCGDTVVDMGCDNSFPEFVKRVNLADVFFTPDSLGFHVACALRTRTVVLVGPTSPWELDVYGAGEVVVADESCVACYQTRCARTPTCMEALDPRRVEEAILGQLALVG